MIRKLLATTVGTGIAHNKSEEESKKAKENLAYSIVKAITSQNPDEVIFFSTPAADETLRIVLEMLQNEYPEEGWYEVVHVNPDDFNECFTQMVKTLKLKKEKAKSIALNYTPGTKTMSAALAAVGALYGFSLIYISGKRVGGLVQKGTEKIISAEPYKFQEELILEKISDFFNRNYFSTALELSKNLRIYPHKEDLQNLLKAYEYWDHFKHHNALDALKKVNTSFLSKETQEQVENNIEFLRKLPEKRAPKNTDLMKRKYTLLLADILQNARRRADVGRYDDAVARLYRALELVAQRALLDYGYIDPISSNTVKEEHLIFFKKFENRKDAKGEYKLGLYDKMRLLRELEHPIGKIFEKDEQIRGLLTARNSSILAHGFRPVDVQTFEKFFKVVDGYAENVVSKKFHRRNMESAKFPKLEFSF